MTKKMVLALMCVVLPFSSAMCDEAPVKKQPVEVGKAAEDGANNGRNGHWVEISIAAAAIIIAVTALILVHKNQGK
jgi:hypothetical protein